MKKRSRIWLLTCSSHFVWEFVLMLQICISIGSMIYLISEWIDDNDIVNYIERSVSQNTIYFQAYDRFEELWENPDMNEQDRAYMMQAFETQIQKIAPAYEIGKVMTSTIFMEDFGAVHFFGYNDAMLDRLHLSVNSHEGDHVSVWLHGKIANSFRVGEEIEIPIYQYGQMYGNVIAKVEGVYSENKLLNPLSGGTYPNCESLVWSCQDEDSFILMRMEETAAIREWMIDPSVFIFPMDCAINEWELENPTQAMGGRFFLMDDIMENTYHYNIRMNRDSLSLAVAALILLIVIIYGYITLTFARNRELLAEFYILGMSRRSMFVQWVMQVSLLNFIAVIICSIVVGLLGSNLVDSILYAAGIEIVFVLALTVGFTLKILRRWEPIECMKGEMYENSH
ncbi:MAG: hypothetical protein Q4E13_05970 [Clostridia bacterium]|nr:hypothetical protein [Clostridia bacterium]